MSIFSQGHRHALQTNMSFYVGALLIASLGCLLSVAPTVHGQAPQTSSAGFSRIATHPKAIEQPSSRGKTLHDITIVGAYLYAGYGDYGDNTGPISIVPYNLTTNAFEAAAIIAPTEEINVFRHLNGSLYAPMIDPRIGWTDPAGYTKLSPRGVWSNERKIPAIHAFDMAALGKDLWMVGSSVEQDGKTRRGATAYRSTDDGATWSIARTDTTVPQPQKPEFERFYWVASLRGSVYMQAAATQDAPLLRFDGTNWHTDVSKKLCSTYDANTVVVFLDTLVCSDNGIVQLFDSTTVTNSTITSKIGSVKDFVIKDATLYVLGASHIARTTDLKTWQLVSAAPPTATSLEVYDSHLIVGTTESQLLRSDATVDRLVAQLATSLPTIGGVAQPNSNTSATLTTPADVVTNQHTSDDSIVLFGSISLQRPHVVYLFISGVTALTVIFVTLSIHGIHALIKYRGSHRNHPSA